MRHHLRKAKEVYASGGPFKTAKSAIRYAPIEVNNLLFRLRHGMGLPVMAEDWDNLLILDACRFDMFSKSVDISGALESRISMGSTSEEFMERNFVGEQFHDTVYVNANPYLPKLNLDEDTFHAVVDCLDEWDEELQTVRPDTVTRAARETHERYSNKRLIVHYMQPHAPFIGERGRDMVGGGWTMDHDVKDKPGIWSRLQKGEEVPLEAVWVAYRENLEIVLGEVETLLKDLNGKTVITADHGNLVGERLRPVPTRRKYGHPYGVHTEELVKVPWFIVEGSSRRDIRAEPPVEHDDESVSKEELENRLRALGYR